MLPVFDAFPDRHICVLALPHVLAAFEAFPDKQYCLLTLPHDSPEPPLVSTFTRLDPLPGASFPEVLYIINRWERGCQWRTRCKQFCCLQRSRGKHALMRGT